jgi:glycosyltransferase involved in cell wall biosynthesis
VQEGYSGPVTVPRRRFAAASPTLRPGVCVVLPTAGGATRIRTPLRSLAAQSLEPRLFEVVVVVNGPDLGTTAVLAEVRREHPELPLRVLHSDRAGAALASWIGVVAARHEHCTFVDDDDRVSPEYLARLLDAAGPWTVVTAAMADVDPAGGGAPGWDNYIQTALDLLEGEVSADDFSQGLGYNAGKLAPTRLARRVGFDVGLGSGQDVLFWTDLMGRFELTFTVLPRSAGAHYFRSVRPDSLSRAHTPGFAEDRLALLGRLSILRHRYPALAGAIQRTLMLGQVNLLAAYLCRHPDDRRDILARLRDLADPAIPVAPLAPWTDAGALAGATPTVAP